MKATAFEAKKKIVEAGNSVIFNDWHRLTNGAVTMDDFIDALEWLCADPCDGGIAKNKLTRELVLKLNKDAENRERIRHMDEYQMAAYGPCFAYREDKVGGKLIRAKRVYGDVPGAPVTFCDEEGMTLYGIIGISARDHI
jgi:hypothetical protein